MPDDASGAPPIACLNTRFARRYSSWSPLACALVLAGIGGAVGLAVFMQPADGAAGAEAPRAGVEWENPSLNDIRLHKFTISAAAMVEATDEERARAAAVQRADAAPAAGSPVDADPPGSAKEVAREHVPAEVAADLAQATEIIEHVDAAATVMKGDGERLAPVVLGPPKEEPAREVAGTVGDIEPGGREVPLLAGAGDVRNAAATAAGRARATAGTAPARTEPQRGSRTRAQAKTVKPLSPAPAAPNAAPNSNAQAPERLQWRSVFEGG